MVGKLKASSDALTLLASPTGPASWASTVRRKSYSPATVEKVDLNGGEERKPYRGGWREVER